MGTRLDRKFFESTRGRIVTLLGRSGCTVEELARELDLTNNGVRGGGGGKPACVGVEVDADGEHR